MPGLDPGIHRSSQEDGLPGQAPTRWPTTLVQIGDFLCARGQVIGEDAQHVAGLDHDLDFADQTRHRVVAGSGEPLRKVSDAIAQDRRSRRHWAILGHLKRRVGLEPCDNAAVSLMKLRPPAIIVVTEVENVGGSRLDRHLLGGRDVIDVGWRHHEIEWLIGIGIVDDVRFGAQTPRKRRPVAAQTAHGNDEREGRAFI